MEFSDKNRPHNRGQKTRPSDNQQTKKERLSRILDFTVPTDDRVKPKKVKRVTVIPTVIGELGTASKGFERGLEELVIRGRIKNIQTTPLL